MRKSEYKNPYMFDTIRPAYVYRALKYLLDQELFKEQGILLSQKWEINNLNNGENYKKFIVESEDEFACLDETTQKNYKKKGKSFRENSLLKDEIFQPQFNEHMANQTLSDFRMQIETQRHNPHTKKHSRAISFFL